MDKDPGKALLCEVNTSAAGRLWWARTAQSPSPTDLVPRKATANTPGRLAGRCCAPAPAPAAAAAPTGRPDLSRLVEAAGRCREPQVGQGPSPRRRLGIIGLGFLLEQNNYSLPEDLGSLEAMWMSAGSRLRKQKCICIQSWKEEESWFRSRSSRKKHAKEVKTRRQELGALVPI